MDDVTWIQLWRQADWGRYARRHEIFGRALSTHPGTRSVIHVEEISIPALLVRFIGLFTLDKTRRKNNMRDFARIFSPSHLKYRENLLLTSVLSLGGNQYSLLRLANKWILQVQLRFKIRTKTTTILILYPPSFLGALALKCIYHDYVLVDLVDDVVTRTRDKIKREFYIQNLKETLPAADRIIATGESLKNYQDFSSTPIEVFPNGVNLASYSHYTEIYPHSSNHTPKIVGYVGSINQTFDESLIFACLRYFPDIEFQFFGFYDLPGRRKIKRMECFKNFQFKGPLAPSSVPAFLASCIALVLPKRADDCAGGDSMKLYQYLAAGKPVVSTSIPPAPSFSDLIHIADSPEEFTNALEVAIKENTAALSTKRRSAVADRDWTSIIYNLATDILNEKQQKRPAARNQTAADP